MDRAEMIVVVPKWTTQAWYAFMNRYLVREPMEIPVNRNVLRLKDVEGRLYEKQHPRVGKMTLSVCHVKA